MAMPVSGCIALRTCITGINCSSIACAVNGSAVGSCSLSTLSTDAGKTAPHCMREFYGYTSPVEINWVQYAQVGTNGVSTYLTRAYCAVPTPAAGTSYTLCFRAHLATVGQPSGSYAGAQITCNFTTKMCCCVGFNVCQTPSVSFLVGSTDCVRVYSCANTTCAACANCVCVHTCMLSITGTGYKVGTSCCDGLICTA